MENKVIEGYCVLTNTISGYELIWNEITGVADNEFLVLPQVFQTERDAQLEILSDLEDDINQYRNNERDWDEIHWPDDEYMIAEIEIKDGIIRVYDPAGGTLVAKEYSTAKIMEISLTDWRNSL